MRSTQTAAICLAGLSLLAMVRTARAEEPDLRATPPFVMIVVDSSGSMEWKPSCPCITDGCSECLPDCSVLNDPLTHDPPPEKKNRWAVLLEALTGKFNNFQCARIARTLANGMSYDVDYPKPYHRPWICPDGTGNCVPDQQANGLLDNYSTRIRFGLMTFDGMRTYAGKSDLVFAQDFSETLSNGKEGSYSYGETRPVHYPTCTHDYLINSGVRSEDAPEGGLIKINSEKCSNPPCDQYEINDLIQSTLLKTRTFGGTPTASALDDLYYHLKGQGTAADSLASCRKRYAILITDGYPDDDFRLYPNPGCNCANEGGCNGDPIGDMKCPYPTPEDAALNLVKGVGTDGPMLKQLFVVGMSISDASARAGLNNIARQGGGVDDATGNAAFFAENPATLTAQLDSVLGKLSEPISRSVPAFATGLTGTQYQVSAGFEISTETPPTGFAAPWKGVLERRRFLCDGGSLSSPTISTEDRFDTQLNSRSSSERRLWTALPSSSHLDKIEGHLMRGTSSDYCGASGCDRYELTSASVTDTLLGVSGAPARTQVLDWMYGAPGSLRENKKLGDIYHSSPTIVGPPTDDPGDESYTLFRSSKVITERPLMMYVGSNDGILHAFSMEAYPPTGMTPTLHSGLTLRAGQEVWGFVPPLLLNNLSSQLTSHQMSMDGTPVVKDVYFEKATTPTATDYKTVLITGMRGGGNAYIALDVTDPIEPKFMWQFTDGDMGQTYGQPAIVQAYYEWPAGQPAKYRAMAILPGGKGEAGVGPGCRADGKTSAFTVPGTTTLYKTLPDPDVTTGTPISHRAEVQCWKKTGRALYFVDVETGKLIKKIFDDDTDLTRITLPSPITGSPVAYQDAVGTVATEAFVIDADGVIWRIDISGKDPMSSLEPTKGWTMRPFHDTFWDKPNVSETSYERPILSLDENRRLLILLGTGDTDQFDKTNADNRVVSLTEITTTNEPASPEHYVAAMNWEMGTNSTDGFVASELVTGTMSLFERQLYFASFISVANVSSPCERGRGRLWSVDYRRRDSSRPNTSLTSGSTRTYEPVRLSVVDASSSGNLANSGANRFNVSVSGAEENLLIQGLGTTQRATCQGPTTDTLNSYYQPSVRLANITQQQTPSIWIVAQASSSDDSRKRAGSMLGSIELQVQRPPALSKVMSWAASTE